MYHFVYTSTPIVDLPYKMTSKHTISRATLPISKKTAQLASKVIAITHGAGAIGSLLCEQAAIGGATVYSLDTDPDALARQTISFRQNKLRVRGIPCYLDLKATVKRAIQEIVSHAPPIDHWIHAEKIDIQDIICLRTSLSAIEAHFELRRKGSLTLLLTSSADAEKKNQGLKNMLHQITEKGIAVNLVYLDETPIIDIASIVVSLPTNAAGIYEYSF